MVHTISPRAIIEEAIRLAREGGCAVDSPVTRFVGIFHPSPLVAEAGCRMHAAEADEDTALNEVAKALAYGGHNEAYLADRKAFFTQERAIAILNAALERMDQE